MKVFWIVLLSVIGLFLLVLALFLLLRVRIVLVYNEKEESAKLKLLFFSYTLYPEARDVLASYGKEEKTRIPVSVRRAQTAPMRVQRSLGELLSLYTELFADAVLPVLSRLGDKLTVDVKKLKVWIANEEAANAAVTYGAAVTAISGFFEFLRNYTNLKVANDGKVFVTCRYDLPKTDFEARIVLKLRFWQAIYVLLPSMTKYLDKNTAEQKDVRPEADAA